MWIQWEIKFIWNNALVSEEYLILEDNLNWAQEWDEVVIEDISRNPNIKSYAVIKIINDFSQKVSNIIEWYFIENKDGSWYIKLDWRSITKE